VQENARLMEEAGAVLHVLPCVAHVVEEGALHVLLEGPAQRPWLISQYSTVGAWHPFVRA